MEQIENKSGCRLCPRECGVDRRKTVGFCGMGNTLTAARADLHMWEEPCLAGEGGSGAVFFSGCSLRCVFCQNHEISHGGKGEALTPERLCALFEALQEKGADNIDLVSPTHFAPLVAKALSLFAPKKRVPVVWNSGGYEKPDTLRRYATDVDIFLPDFKYVTPALSERYSAAPDYAEHALRALETMLDMVGYSQFSPSDNSRMTRGVLVRHLILPNHIRESFRVLDRLAEHFDPKRLYISLLCQYTPTYRASQYPEINRRLTTLEYRHVLDYAASLGFCHGFSQERSAAKEEYVPQFFDTLPEI